MKCKEADGSLCKTLNEREKDSAVSAKRYIHTYIHMYLVGSVSREEISWRQEALQGIQPSTPQCLQQLRPLTVLPGWLAAALSATLSRALDYKMLPQSHPPTHYLVPRFLSLLPSEYIHSVSIPSHAASAQSTHTLSGST